MACGSQSRRQIERSATVSGQNSGAHIQQAPSPAACAASKMILRGHRGTLHRHQCARRWRACRRRSGPCPPWSCTRAPAPAHRSAAHANATRRPRCVRRVAVSASDRHAAARPWLAPALLCVAAASITRKRQGWRLWADGAAIAASSSASTSSRATGNGKITPDRASRRKQVAERRSRDAAYRCRNLHWHP